VFRVFISSALLGSYDEPKTAPYQILQFCPISADGRHFSYKAKRLSVYVVKTYNTQFVLLLVSFFSTDTMQQPHDVQVSLSILTYKRIYGRLNLLI